MTDSPGAARNGANLILHHLGDSTQADIQDVERACRDLGAKTVIVPGDIANQETASAVSVSLIEEMRG
jgi:L-rhamnose 1-dehydrogenase